MSAAGRDRDDLPVPADCYVGARLAARSARGHYVASGVLERRGLYGPAAALAVMAFEEAVKAIAWLLLSLRGDDDDDAELVKLVHRSLRGHRGRFAVAAPFVILIQPWAMLVYGLLTFLGRRGGWLPDDPILGVLRDPPTLDAGPASELWGVRRRGLYLDREDGSWVGPHQATAEDAERARALAGQYVRGARRLLRAVGSRPVT